MCFRFVLQSRDFGSAHAVFASLLFDHEHESDLLEAKLEMDTSRAIRLLPKDSFVPAVQLLALFREQVRRPSLLIRSVSLGHTLRGLAQ